MTETLNLNYYYGNEADKYSFYRIPKILLTNRRHQGVSLEAKVLYDLLLDRMSIDYLAMPGIDRVTAQREGELVTLQKWIMGD